MRHHNFLINKIPEMKKTICSCTLLAIAILALQACNNQPASTGETTNDSSAVVKKDSVDPTKNWKIGVQLWTFSKFPFVTAIAKADSAGVKYVEAYSDEPLGGDMKGNFGPNMTAENKAKGKQLLQSKGISIVAMGVIVPKDLAEWKKYFEFGKEFGLSYFTAEPIKTQWNGIDSLAGIYGIRVAIHDHPKMNVYWHPDSVLAATVGHPNIGSCADIGHWARNGLDPVECLKKLEGHIIGVHLKDITKFDDVHAADTIVGTGVIKWPGIFQELKRQNFSGMFSIEHESNWYNNVPDVIQTVKFYNEQVAQLK